MTTRMKQFTYVLIVSGCIASAAPITATSSLYECFARYGLLAWTGMKSAGMNVFISPLLHTLRERFAPDCGDINWIYAENFSYDIDCGDLNGIYAENFTTCKGCDRRFVPCGRSVGSANSDLSSVRRPGQLANGFDGALELRDILNDYKNS